MTRDEPTRIHGAGAPMSPEFLGIEESFIARAPSPIAAPYARIAATTTPAAQLACQCEAYGNIVRYLGSLALACAQESAVPASDLDRALEQMSTSDLVAWVGAFDRLVGHLDEKDPVASALLACHQLLEVEQKLRMREIVDMKAVEVQVGQLASLARFERSLPSLDGADPNVGRRSAEFHRKALRLVLPALDPILRFRLVHVEEPKDGAARVRELVGPKETYPPVARELPGAIAGQVYLERPGKPPLDLHPLVVFRDCYERYKADPNGDPREAFVFKGHAGRRIHYQGTRHTLTTQELSKTFHDRFAHGRASAVPLDPASTTAAQLAGWLAELARDKVYDPKQHVARKTSLSRLAAHAAQRRQPLLVMTAPAGDGKTSVLAHFAQTLSADGHWVLPVDLAPRRPVGLAAIFEEVVGRPLREFLLAAAPLVPADKRLVIVVDHLERHLQRELFEELVRLAGNWDREFPFVCWVAALRTDAVDALAQDDLGARALAASALASSPRPSFDGPVDRPYFALPPLDDEERDRLYEIVQSRAGHRTLTPLHLLKQSTLEMFRRPIVMLAATDAYRGREIRSSARVADVLARYCRKRFEGHPEKAELARSLAKALWARRRELASIDALLDGASGAFAEALLSDGAHLAALEADGVVVRSAAGGGPFADKQLRFAYPIALAYLAAEALAASPPTPQDLAALAKGPIGAGIAFEVIGVILAQSEGELEHARTAEVIEAGGPLLRSLAARLLAEDDAHSSSRAEPSALAVALSKGVHGARALFDLAAELHARGDARRAQDLLELLAAGPLAKAEPVDYYLARLQLDKRDAKEAAKSLKRAEKQMRAPTPEWDYKLTALAVELAIGQGQAAGALGLARKLFDRLSVAGARDPLLSSRLLVAQTASAAGERDEAGRLFQRALEAAFQANLPAWILQVRRRYAEHLVLAGDPAGAAEQFLTLAVELARAGRVAEQVECQLAANDLVPAPAAERLSRLEGAVAAVEPLGPSMLLARALAARAQVHELEDRTAPAEADLRRALELARQFGDEAFQAELHARLGELLQSKGDLQNALDGYAKSIELRKRKGERKGMARTYHHIALIFRDMLEPGKSVEYFGKAIELAGTAGDVVAKARAQAQVAVLLAAQGDDAGAARHLREARTPIEQGGDTRAQGELLWCEGQIEQERGDHARATELYRKAAEVQERAGDRRGLALTYSQLALSKKAAGDHAGAIELFGKSAALCEARGDRRGLAAACNNLGVIHEAAGDRAKALEYFERDLALVTEMRDAAGMATSFGNLAIVHYNQRNFVKALYCLEQAREIHRRSGDAAALAEVEERITRVRARL